MGKNRAFSLYDIEQFLKEAGAERINERAVVSLEEELESTVKELVDEAQVYANYAGRTRLIKSSDIRLVSEIGRAAPGKKSDAARNRIRRARKNVIRINGIVITRVHTPSE